MHSTNQFISLFFCMLIAKSVFSGIAFFLVEDNLFGQNGKTEINKDKIALTKMLN